MSKVADNWHPQWYEILYEQEGLCKMEQKRKWYWLSFSLKGVNQGVCNVQANNSPAALSKAKKLGLIPKYDDIEEFIIDDAELPPDIFFTRRQMINKDYNAAQYHKIS